MSNFFIRNTPQSQLYFTLSTVGWPDMYYNKLSGAGLALLSFFLFFSAVFAAPLPLSDYGTTSSDADLPRHLTPVDTGSGIIHHISAMDQSSQTMPSNPPSIFKRDGGELQFDFPARRSRFKSAFKVRLLSVKSHVL